MSEPDPFEGRHDRIEALRDDLEEVLNEYRRTEGACQADVALALLMLVADFLLESDEDEVVREGVGLFQRHLRETVENQLSGGSGLS